MAQTTVNLQTAPGHQVLAAAGKTTKTGRKIYLSRIAGTKPRNRNPLSFGGGNKDECHLNAQENLAFLLTLSENT
ncbi:MULTISPECIES: hypothetical protein [Aerosakkonema]|uniref:hypothetical protein n=1 Tax=Aerosakkonema TaxID=1246629 RepID=UPI0035B73246